MGQGFRDRFHGKLRRMVIARRGIDLETEQLDRNMALIVIHGDDGVILAGYREMIPAFLRQLHNEDYFIKRALPPTARPYREDLHGDMPMAAAAE